MIYRNVIPLLMLWVAVPTIAHDPVDGQPHAHESENAFFTTRDSPQTLPPTKSDDAFHFVIYGDRTGGVPAGLQVLEQAVTDTKLIDPDLVMTVGDLVQGYNTTEKWMPQMTEFKEIMNRLPMPWYPVAGNHDVYWVGSGPAPPGQHESNYESNFAPLWYSFQHKNAGFIVLYSDEGDPDSNQKGFHEARLQQMSARQLKFLDESLAKLKDAQHVFVFLHHPRWIESRYEGSNWPVVHEKLVAAGNVHAVFAGHIHRIRYGGLQDGIEYHALATTGGALHGDIPGAGYLHHFNMVTVRPDSFTVAAIPVGSVIDPKDFDDEFVAAIDQAEAIRPIHQSGELVVAADGSMAGELVYQWVNDSPAAIDATIGMSLDASGWQTNLDHDHFTLQSGESRNIEVQLSHPGSEDWTLPRLSAQIDFLAEKARVALPETLTPLPISLNQVPANYFTARANTVLRVSGADSAARVDNDSFELPDGPMTLEAMIHPTNKSGYQGVIAKNQNSDYGFFYDEGLIDFSIFLKGKYQSVRSRDPLPTDRMTHIAGVYDGQEVRLYVDGKLVRQTGVAGKRRTNDLPLWIGADPDRAGQASRPFDGWIDEVRLSKVARYQGETIDVNSRHAPDADTVLLFHFDNRLGPFELDHSASATKAVLGPAATLVPVP